MTPFPKQHVTHASDCAVNNAPALPVGPCDCGAEIPSSDWWTHDGAGNWKDKRGGALTTAPMQPSKGRIPYVVAEEAWKEYDAQGHGSQSLRRLNERGGFSAEEIILHLYERIRRIQGMPQ